MRSAMYSVDVLMPAQAAVSELSMPSGVNWAFLALNDGAVDTAVTTISNDARANVLTDFTISGTLGTAWSVRPGWFTANNSANAVQLLSADAGLAPVFDFIGKTLLIGFQCLLPYGASRETILHIGGGGASQEYGLHLAREANSGRLTVVFRGQGGTVSTQAGPRVGDMYTITGISAGATPTITVTHPTKTAHRLTAGRKVYISNENDTTLSPGIYTVQSAPTDLTFTIDATENGGAAATGDGTSGAVGVECNVFVVIDDVNKTAQMWVNQIGETSVDAGSQLDYSSIADLTVTGGSSPRVGLFVGDNGTNLLSSGQIRRLLVVNYGAIGMPDAIPALTTRIMPALRDSGMLPTYRMVG